MTTRRQFVAGAMAGVAAGALIGGRANAQAGTQIRISTAAPPSDFLAKALESLKADVEAAKVGLNVSVHPASTLFKQGTEVPALQRGNLEMSTMTTFEVAQQMPALGLFNRGYLFKDYAHMRRVFDGPIGADYRKAVADKMGIEILATHYLGTRQVNLRQKRAVNPGSDHQLLFQGRLLLGRDTAEADFTDRLDLEAVVLDIFLADLAGAEGMVLDAHQGALDLGQQPADFFRLHAALGR